MKDSPQSKICEKQACRKEELSDRTGAFGKIRSKESLTVHCQDERQGEDCGSDVAVPAQFHAVFEVYAFLPSEEAAYDRRQYVGHPSKVEDAQQNG